MKGLWCVLLFAGGLVWRDIERTSTRKNQQAFAQTRAVISFVRSGFSTPQNRTMPRRPEPEPIRGDLLNVTAGSYKGRRVWKNNAKTDTPKMIYVIIDMGDGKEITTRIKKSSVGPPPENPTSYEEAAVQQIPDLHYHLKKAAYHLAKCQISDWEEASRLFTVLCQEAQLELEALGPKASYYNIDYDG